MSLNAVKLLEISITTNSRQEILEYLRKYLEKPPIVSRQSSAKSINPLTIFTPNPEQIVLAQSNKRFAEIFNRADVALPDGIGLLWANQYHQPSTVNHQQSTIKERISGISLMQDLAEVAAKQGYNIALIGGRGGVAVKALECLQGWYPGLRGWAEETPEIKIESTNLPRRQAGLQKGRNQQYNNLIIEQLGREIADEYIASVVDKIRQTDTRIVFVALGAPKQEFFIEKLRTKYLEPKTKDKKVLSSQFSVQDPLILMAVGGAFDEISGRLPQTPRFIDQIGLKWFWRLILEPWRWRRQLALLKFIWLVICEKLASKGNALRS